MRFYMGMMLLLQAAGVVLLQPGDVLHAFTCTVNYEQHPCTVLFSQPLEVWPNLGDGGRGSGGGFGLRVAVSTST